MLVVIVVKRALQSCFSKIHTCGAGAGIMGVLVCPLFLYFSIIHNFGQGNKGGTAIRVTFTPPLHTRGDLGSATFTFVNSHLAAFDEQYDKRNSDFQDLSRRLNFDSEILDSTELATLPINIYESDVLFWMVHFYFRFCWNDSLDCCLGRYVLRLCLTLL
jgi:inositol polyphosphate 5-phosphatase INPP5B/F